jgi:hypothetical protein
MKLEIINPQFKGNPVELLATLGIPWDDKTHGSISITTEPDGRITIDNLPGDIVFQVQAVLDPATTVVALQAKITSMESTLKTAKLM